MTVSTLPGAPPMASVKRAGVTPGDVASPARGLAPSGADASPARLVAGTADLHPSRGSAVAPHDWEGRAGSAWLNAREAAECRRALGLP